MKRITTLATATLLAAFVGGSLLPQTAMADGKYRDHGRPSGGERYDRKHHKHHDYDRHHHDRRPVYIVAPPYYGWRPHHHRHDYGYWCGSNLGFGYDSWTDSFRLGGNFCFY